MTRPAYARPVLELVFCEGSWASTASPWHVRATHGQVFPGGGAPGGALCGRDLAGGWDLPDVEVTVDRVASLRDTPHGARPGVCGRCADAATATLTRAGRSGE